MRISVLNRKLRKAFGGRVTAAPEDNCIVLRGTLDRWDDVVRAGQMAATKYSTCHVVNDITFTGGKDAPMRVPALRDDALDGQTPDVLIIGGGISGVSIARELTRQKLDILVVDKECDLALGASGRNDGEVHPGIDLGRGSVKHKYIRRGNAMFDQVCKELDVPFSRVGQYVCFQHGWLRPAVWCYCMWRKYHDGISDTRLISGRELLRREPNFNEKTRFAISNPDSGCVCPYGLTIAYAENAVQNGARIALNTAVLGMDVADGKITAVHTNRGTLHPALVINAAGVFAEDVARMADDRFFSIHPRRGTNSILDRKAGAFMHSIASVKGTDTVSKTHSKGGGILHTVHDNLLIGPDAVETYEKENTATHPESIAHVFEKQKITMPALTERDIITYFTGVRAPTFEEDFIIERGRRTHNLIHVAGIQSPGLTTAPAVAEDVADMAVRILARERPVAANPDFDPHRPGIPVLREMDDATRAAYIAKNPDYGVIVCRCEEISRGEILDALRSNVCVPTVDGVKKRVRPGMGRCQGGFCSPQVVRIIAEFLGVPLSEVRKSSADAPITFGPTKSGEVQARCMTSSSSAAARAGSQPPSPRTKTVRTCGSSSARRVWAACSSSAFTTASASRASASGWPARNMSSASSTGSRIWALRRARRPSSRAWRNCPAALRSAPSAATASPTMRRARSCWPPAAASARQSRSLSTARARRACSRPAPRRTLRTCSASCRPAAASSSAAVTSGSSWRAA